MSAKNVKKRLNKKELAEGYIFLEKLTTEQQIEASAALMVARKKVQSELTGKDLQTLRLMQLKFKVDNYFNSQQFDPEMSFSNMLKEYAELLDKKRKTFAEEINITEAELSQLINNHRSPNQSILIRLEFHSNSVLRAVDWYKLLEREKEHELNTNMQLREREEKYVSNRLNIDLK